MNHNPKISKSLSKEYEDLCDYSILLHDAIHFFQFERFAYYKSLLFLLRVLVADNSTARKKDHGLLLRLMKHFNIQYQIIIEGMKGISQTNPLSRDRTLTLEEYMNIENILDGKKISYRDLIWKISNEEGSHSSDKLSPEVVRGQNVFISNLSANEKTILNISIRVVAICDEVISQIIRMPSHKDST